MGVDPLWYGVAGVALPLVHVAGVRLAARTGEGLPIHTRALALLPIFLITSAGEEIGWRGYALPVLAERHGVFKAALIVGLGWAAFHAVALMTNADAPVAYVVVSTVLFTGLSVIIAYVFDGSGQAVPVTVVMHAAYNTVSVGIMPFAETQTPLRAFGASALVAWGVALGLVFMRAPRRAATCVMRSATS
jgi:membrane protease YdiL (CAAX protease family)